MKKLLKKGIVAAACAVSMLAGFGTANATDYDYIDLYKSSSLLEGYAYKLNSGRYDSKALGINDDGTVVGYLKGRWNNQSGSHVVTWDLNDGGKATDLGVMGSVKNNANAYGISENGQIAGTYRSRIGSSQVYKPFTYDLNTGTQTNLTTKNTSPTALAFDVNNSGQTVGYTTPYVGTALTPFQEPNRDQSIKTAYISNTDGTVSHIPGAAVGTTTTDGSQAYSINNAGQVTGYTTVDGNALAFLYDSSTDAFKTLGTLGGLTSTGTAINESGAIVGYSTLTDGSERAFLYSEGTMIDLGSMGDVASDAVSSRAYGINDAGDVVGTSNGHAFLYSDGHMIDLNTLIDPALGITLTRATGINNLGQIIGYSTLKFYDSNGKLRLLEDRAFALTPSVTPTPIPPTVLLFGSGLAGLGVFRRRFCQG